MSIVGSEELIEEIANRLHVAYGEPDLGNKVNPLDELIFIILTTMTTDKSSQRVYEAFRRRFPSWEDVEHAELDDVRIAILDAGLSRQKAPRIKAILHRVREDFDELSLSRLETWSDDEAEAYLRSLPGVGKKVARCVLMFSFERELLPVDTHVRRLMNRIGLSPTPPCEAAAHDVFQDFVPPAHRYAFHVNAVAHGRGVCVARAPRCGSCVLRDLCAFGSQQGGE